LIYEYKEDSTHNVNGFTDESSLVKGDKGMKKTLKSLIQEP